MSVEMPPARAVSVVMTTYNGQRFLREQIDSIIQQLQAGDELIISDDGSTDGTLAILDQYRSDRTRIVEAPGGLGPIRNFEHALGHASRNIVVLSDQDDKWLPGRLEQTRDHFGSRSARPRLVMQNSMITDRNLKPTDGPLFDYLSAGPGLFKNLRRNTYVGCHLAFSRDLLDFALPFPRAIPMHDVWLGLVAETVGNVTFDPRVTMLFRRSGFNYTQARYSLGQRLLWRAGLVTSLLQLQLRIRGLGLRAQSVS